MKRVFHKNCKLCFRAVLLAGVLAGLFFSSGEGVRLFPFPSAEVAKNKQSRFGNKNKIPYQFNIHRFENGQGNFQSKTHRDNSLSHSANNDNALNKPPFFATKTGNKIDFPHGSEIFKSRLFYTSSGSRAPPVS